MMIYIYIHIYTLWLNYHSYGKSPFLVGKYTMSMAIFNSYVKLPEGIYCLNCMYDQDPWLSHHSYSQ